MKNGLTKSELITLGVGIIIIIVLLFVGGKLISPPRGNYTLPMTQTQSQQNQTQDQQALGQNISTDSNIQIYDTQVGTGTVAKIGDKVTVNYIGTLQDGTKFDSSFDRNQPFQFTLGAGQVIKGWEIGIQGMKVGGKRRLVISPSYGYGDQKVGPIPANSTLVFDVELLGTQPSK